MITAGMLNVCLQGMIAFMALGEKLFLGLFLFGVMLLNFLPDGSVVMHLAYFWTCVG